ncbi:MAG: type VI secretion system ATPase TssH, partial [Spirochaetia bacterium]|nr:type VI secretion system ATPase TssH [Spirochaetia bacterium]
MRLDKITVKTAEAVNAAQDEAAKRGNPEAAPEHLLMELVRQDSGMAQMILSRIGVPVASVSSIIEKYLDSLPRVEGQQDVRPSAAFAQVLTKAQAEAKKRGDQYLSGEHVLLAYLGDKQNRLVGQLSALGLTVEVVVEALKDLRGG